jgi:hypothetical protein
MFCFLSALEIGFLAHVSRMLYPQARNYVFTERKWWTISEYECWEKPRPVRRVVASDYSIETLLSRMTDWRWFLNQVLLIREWYFSPPD